MREIVHIQAGQCGNQIGAKVNIFCTLNLINDESSMFITCREVLKTKYALLPVLKAGIKLFSL